MGRRALTNEETSVRDTLVWMAIAMLYLWGSALSVIYFVSFML